MQTSTFIMCAVFTPAGTTDFAQTQSCAELEPKITTVNYEKVKPTFTQQAVMS